MNFSWITFSIIILIQILYTSSRPFTDEDGDNFSIDDSDLDARRRHKNKRKPCQREIQNEERTFFQFSYVDVNYNNNYNCGNDPSPNKRPQKRPHNRPGHNRPGHNNNNNKEETEVDMVDMIDENTDDLPHFSTTRRPHRPLGNFIMNHNGEFIQNLFGNLFGNNPKPQSRPIPVHEDIINDETTIKYEPGLYVNAYNPINGQYLQGNITNSKRILRRISKGIDFFLNPLYDLI